MLLVDDNHDALDSMSELLMMLGHDVRTAADGPAAIAAATGFRPDMILCDIGLPLLDGSQVIAHLRGLSVFAATRFVALTGCGREEDVRRSLAAGFHVHLVKPVDLVKLAGALASAE